MIANALAVILLVTGLVLGLCLALRTISPPRRRYRIQYWPATCAIFEIATSMLTGYLVGGWGEEFLGTEIGVPLDSQHRSPCQKAARSAWPNHRNRQPPTFQLMGSGTSRIADTGNKTTQAPLTRHLPHHESRPPKTSRLFDRPPPVRADDWAGGGRSFSL